MHSYGFPQKTPVADLILVLVSAYCMPWYMGSLYYRFTTIPFLSFNSENGKLRQIVRRIIFGIFLLVMVFIFISLIPLTSAVLPEGFNAPGPPVMLLCIAMLFLITGSIQGGISFNRLTGRDTAPDKDGMEMVSTVALGMASLFGMLGLISMPGFYTRHSPFLITILVIASFFMSVIFMGIIGITTTRMLELKSRYAGSPVLNTVSRFTLPLINTFFLAGYSDLMAGFVSGISGTGADFKSVSVFLIFSGYLPFRILMMAAPPVSGLNLFTGAAAVYFWIRSLWW